jgi:hypothetical protein
MKTDRRQIALQATRRYDLYVCGEQVARLEWRTPPGDPPGWFMLRGDERMPLAGEAGDVPAALDACALALYGPPERPVRELAPGRYELHVGHLDAGLLDVAFPHQSTASAEAVSVLAGTFDDAGLSVVMRRVSILGGRVLAIVRARSGRFSRRSP